jgi:hypothetical protein
MSTRPAIEGSTSELPRPIGPEPSPFWPQHLVDLFLRPTRFFAGHLALGRTPYVVLVTWALGMSSVIDRIDTRILQAELRNDPARWEALESLVGTWPRLWALVLGGGLVAGALAWSIGGWWCRVRLGWCGAKAPDKRLARLLLIYSSFVFAGPAVVALLVQTLLHPDYLAAYDAPLDLSLVVLPMVFWSLFTTERGALALFPVSRGRARLWFVVLPALFFFLLMGGVGLLVSAVASGEPS